MKELLEKWAKLAPEECAIMPRVSYAALQPAAYFSCFDDYADEYDSGPDSALLNKQAKCDLALIEFAVQSAIEAREGWQYECSNTYLSTRFSYSAIVRNGSTHVCDGYSKNSMAEALLQAYLLSLEAYLSLHATEQSGKIEYV
ncbi:MAG TPA: hypothetical protein VEF04_12970 [Blastocatellia bacterium]|nr:hypothetical protein [Blastocatellia bacterium]